MTSSLRLVIIQPTPFCNINCTYCYLADRSDSKIISIDTIKAIARFLRDVPKREEPLSVVWHAGEPLVVKRSLYEQAFEILSDNVHSFPIHHNFQTNGILIDDEWCEFFLRHHVNVGLSIDGPKQVHDSKRITRAGLGTFDRVMTGVSKLQKHGIRFTIIGVITPALLLNIDETLRFFADLGVERLAFNVEEVEGVHAISSLYESEIKESIVEFFEKLSRLQTAQPSLNIRELDSIRGHLRAPVGCNIERSTNQVGGILNFDVEGNVSTFSPELLGTNSARYGRFIWANAHRDTWQGVLRNPDFQRARDDIAAGVDRCSRSCGYFAICGGGDPSNKLSEHGTFDAAETQCCRLHLKAIADVVIAESEKLLNHNESQCF